MRCKLLVMFWLALAMSPVAPGAAAQEVDDCLVCHGDRAAFEGNLRAGQLVVSKELFLQSVHGTGGLDCTACHEGMGEVPHPSGTKPAGCETCHSDVGEKYSASLHGYALSRGNPRAPRCASCHGVHDVLPSSNPRSPTHKVRLPSTCATCHGTAGLLTDHLVKLPQSFTAYAESVHGQGTGRGIAAAASCADCHGVHELQGAADPTSRINPRNVATTCGQCHPDIQIQYDRSIHGRALEAGVTDSPTCTDCHGEHLILSSRNPGARTSSARLATETCGRCHDDPLIVAKFNLAGGVVGSYIDSYHGWAARRDYVRAATCISCHGAHSVLPAADPESMTHTSNVVGTCRQCHPNADLTFSASYTHESASITANPINRWIRSIYIFMIALIIGGMVVHNLVIMNFFMIERRKKEESSEWILRFDRIQIVQHLLLTLTFVVLVLTGFALRFPGAWWVRWLTEIGLSEPVRLNLHRIAAVILIGVSASHAYYVLVTERGKKEFREMLPTRRDFRDFLANVRYYTWRSGEQVKFGRYDYSQKAEYWALVWGTILMIMTGFILWFPVETARFLPARTIPAAQTIHYYEAWLATLAILVWHFFFVIFHPEEYPMSWTWLTGRMTKKAVQRHHTRWHEEEIAPSTARQPDTDPPAGGGAGAD
ncbi:MAG: cytochrome b/b6 domain-containing protein [Acidobacteriota bacterium]